MAKAGDIFTFCNPLLDISATVKPELLEKFGLKANDAILAEDKHNALFEELVKDYDVQYIAGGATQNSARVAQALIGVDKCVVYTGCVGDDDNAKELGKQCETAGVQELYQKDGEASTGLCAVLITDEGKNRSLVTALGAANNYKHAHTETEAVQGAIKAAKVYYGSGFFQTVCPETMMHVAKHARDEGKIFTTNLSAPFLMQVPPFLAATEATLPFVDILFGNETEAATWAEVKGWEEKDVAEIAKKLSAEVTKGTVVITQGADPTIVVFNGEVTTYPVNKVEKLVDTNGAGDAFVGGFLSKLVLVDAKANLTQDDIAECVRAGAYAAEQIIQRDGCTIPADFAVPPKA